MMITFVFFFYLLKLGVPPKKLVIGAAFYTRIWKDVASINNGLYQSGAATNGIDFKDFDTKLTKDKGWNYFWDKKHKLLIGTTKKSNCLLLAMTLNR